MSTKMSCLDRQAVNTLIKNADGHQGQLFFGIVDSRKRIRHVSGKRHGTTE